MDGASIPPMRKERKYARNSPSSTVGCAVAAMFRKRSPNTGTETGMDPAIAIESPAGAAWSRTPGSTPMAASASRNPAAKVAAFRVACEPGAPSR